ncbi:MAG: tetraacyldisaccharide 4'-kinase [Halioglobus sp.]
MAGAESALVTAWYQGAWWLYLLRPLEFVFRCVVALRKSLYRSGLVKQFTPSKPVVIVGNITVGGTGKTPIVLALIEYLQLQGIRPGLVSRGYGSSRSNYPYSVSRHSTAEDCGDEALLIYQRTGCPCVVSPQRVDAVRQLLSDFDVDVILSDDGLQHYALARHMEIAVLDETRRIGNGFCLPAGPLREPASRLRKVDYVLYRGSLKPDLGVQYVAIALVHLVTGRAIAVAPDTLEREVYAVSGIGQPEQFYQTLRESGFQLDVRTFGDHHAYSSGDFAGLEDKPIIMTEKDAVKCRGFLGDNAWYLKIEARIPKTLCSAVLALAKDSKG